MVSLQDRQSRREQGHVSETEEQAVGIVMAIGRLGADQARAVLAEVAQRSHITLRRIAGLVTAWVSSGELNLGIRIALEEAIRHQSREARPVGPPAE
ncbi:ANTAR domain-containing protein [Streptomyces sp. NPDC001914]|uniref:ANTAR domain-containing protein n=1 Tax=Streptomyces sp. NPDC001914 TaxID=3364623 RepID=UPI00369C9668